LVITVGGLDYYYLDEGKWLFAQALFHNVPHLVSPFDAKICEQASFTAFSKFPKYFFIFTVDKTGIL